VVIRIMGSTFCRGKETSQAGIDWEEGASIMSVEERVPNERLRHARSLKGWSQAKLAEEVGTSFEMVSRWERGVTTPTLYFRAKLCEALQMTAEELGLVHDASEVLALPTSPFVFLACSYADSEKAAVTRIKMMLQKRGITLWGSHHIGRQGLEQPRKALGEAPRARGVRDWQDVPAPGMWGLDRGGKLAGVSSPERTGTADGD
jgi:transcriptional regulator with XRE-family HTH domain